MGRLHHIRHHGRFYSAVLAGLALWLTALALHWPLPPLAGGDAFFLIYLALMGRFALGVTPEGLRRRASVEDEGIPLIILLALAAVVLSLAAIFALLGRPDAPDPAELSLAVVSVPLGWLMLHTILASTMRTCSTRRKARMWAMPVASIFPTPESRRRGTSSISRSSSA